MVLDEQSREYIIKKVESSSSELEVVEEIKLYRKHINQLELYSKEYNVDLNNLIKEIILYQWYKMKIYVQGTTLIKNTIKKLINVYNLDSEDIDDEYKLDFNEGNLGIYLKATGDLIRLRRDFIVDVTRIVFADKIPMTVY